ncbi:MAG: phosphate ABC transporter permease subunit PstC [Acidipropionibacterium jensenii]|nr:phosphate ABC transporter permease subunit PstC [Acidipropionibacterium jensenii]
MAEPNAVAQSHGPASPHAAGQPDPHAAGQPDPHPTRVQTKPPSRVGDRIFSGTSATVAILLAVLVVLIFAFLVRSAIPALQDNESNFFTTRTWSTDSSPLNFGIAAMAWTTAISSIIALAVAVPLAIGIALFITQMAPPRLAGPVAFVVDLLAAVPSIIFGLWGSIVLSQAGFLEWIRSVLATLLGWIPIFRETPSWTDVSGTVFLASTVLAIMILPIITATSRDVMAQTPTDQIEASLALGATRWEVIKMAVLPHARSGIISGSMLGLGRALGETLAVTLILQQVSQMQLRRAFDPSIFTGGDTFASKIARDFPEALNDPKSLGALVASGLALFVITFFVNGAARMIAERGVKR